MARADSLVLARERLGQNGSTKAAPKQPFPSSQQPAQPHQPKGKLRFKEDEGMTAAEEEERAAAELLSRRARRFAAMMQRSSTVRCFMAWQSMYQRAVRERRIIRRVAAHMRNGMLLRVLRGWAVAVADLKRERCVVVRFALMEGGCKTLVQVLLFVVVLVCAVQAILQYAM